MTTIPCFKAAFAACEVLRIRSAGHGLSVSTPGDDLLHGVGAGAALLKAGLLAFVPQLAVRPHFTTDLPTLVLLVATVVGVAGELAGVAAAQPGITGKIAAALGEVVPDVFVSDNSLFILGMAAVGLEKKTGIYHLPFV